MSVHKTLYNSAKKRQSRMRHKKSFYFERSSTAKTISTLIDNNDNHTELNSKPFEAEETESEDENTTASLNESDEDVSIYDSTTDDDVDNNREHLNNDTNNQNENNKTFNCVLEWMIIKSTLNVNSLVVSIL